MRPRRTALTLAVALPASLGVAVIGPETLSSPPEAQAAVRKNIDTDYTLLRRGPRSYVIGTAHRGWTVDVQGPANAGYRWGRVFGDLNMCLWTYEGATVATVPSAGCDTYDGVHITAYGNVRRGWPRPARRHRSRARSTSATRCAGAT